MTVRGVGFAGLGTDLSMLACAFTGAAGIATAVNPDGTMMVCNTTATVRHTARTEERATALDWRLRGAPSLTALDWRLRVAHAL